MRAVFVSDTHLIDLLRKTPLEIPDGDVLVHCGDATMRGDYEEIALFATRFAAYPHKHKIFVPGNHDCSMEGQPADVIEGIDWAHVLIDRGVTIDGIKFWGSPWQPEFCNWAFNLPRGPALKAHWDLIPADTDVLVTHSPPMGVLDRVWRVDRVFDKKAGHIKLKRQREHVGCADLLQAVKRVNPRVHAFGHIHCDYGVRKSHGLPVRTTFVNCALADEGYFLSHSPVVIDL